MAEADSPDHRQQAHLDLLRADLAYVHNRGNDASPLLFAAAGRLEGIDAHRSRMTYLDALMSAIFAGRLAKPGGSIAEIAKAAGVAPPPTRYCPTNLLLDGLAAQYNTGYASGLPQLRAALAGFTTGAASEADLRHLYLAGVLAIRLWDDERWDALSARHLDLVRAAGALGELPPALTSRTYLLLFTGNLTAAATLTDEAASIAEATGSHLTPYGALGIAALRGDEARTRALVTSSLADATDRGEGVGVTFTEWANAILHNGLGRYPEAFAAALRATAFEVDPGSSIWASVELIEAAIRSGHRETATAAHRALADHTTAAGTDWALGSQARCAALLAEGEAAETLYREAIQRLRRTRIRLYLARTHLLYGEWLRRERRRADAREQLHTAQRMFESMGVHAFADRAQRELQATGETARRRVPVSATPELTAQEARIARLAADGLSNPEIATRLFLSARTVQYHLGKVFAKLGITSRAQLDTALPDAGT
jgi:DNA-binding CsgD family transcriptional regulator